MNKNRLVTATFCMFLIVMLPICMADTFEQEGETLIIEAKQYEPEVLRSDYMEQLDIPVRVILGAIRGEPISVPEINSVDVKLIKKQEAQKQNASVQGTADQTIKDYIAGTPKFYKAPYPTLDNLGYVQITLKKIPKETNVPKQIDLDFQATINYEAEITGFTIGGENQKELKIATVPTIKENPDDYKILGGRYYLRVVDITTEGASVEVLDPDFARLTSLSLRTGIPSGSITLSYKDQAEPDHIRLKLEEVRGVGNINLELEVAGKLETKTFEKNKEIDRGWKVSSYYTGKEDDPKDDFIILTNKEFKAPVMLSTEDKFDEIKDLKSLIENCGTNECKIYANSKIQNLQTYSVNRELFTQALNSLEEIGLTRIVSITSKTTGRTATIQIGGKAKPYTVGEKIGTCGCKIYSITKDEVRVSGIKDCNKNEKSDTEILKTGDSISICGTVLQLKEITTDEKAVITVLPGTGRGKTTTYFSVHIPVEKRAIQYTPEELQDKINKTEALIKKLDGTINQLQKLVEGWTKVCLATMAIFTVMAFFQGVSGTPPKKEAGTQTGGSTQPGEGKKIIIFPEGVKLNNLQYGYDSKSGGQGGSLSLREGETYYLKDMEMYDSQNTLIAFIGGKFKDKSTNIWYILTSEGKLEKTDASHGNWGVGDGEGKYDASFSQGGDIAVGLQNCAQIPLATSGEINYRDLCKSAEKTYGTALEIVYYKNSDHLSVVFLGADKKLGTQDDIQAFPISEKSSAFKELKKDLLNLQEANKRGERTATFRGYKYPNVGKTFTSGTTPGDVDCRMVMDESRCKILFNACDPVMCPPSRCNFGGRYKVDNVIQSGLIGSLLLCLPNIKDGVIIPICLSGVLASLKNIRSILQGYVDCLKTALNDQKSVGICDRIRSIFMCEILWKEAMTLLGIAGGNLFDKAVGSGGGEYLTGLKGGVDNAKKTVDYFTNSYASSIFASYKGKSTKDIGSVICEKAIYGKGPLLGDIVQDVTKAQNPTQFTAYIEEQPLYQATEQKSMYKLYYHIYAGAQPTDYKVYVKKSSTGKTFVCNECSGTLEAEGYIDKSTLFTLEPGYNTICVKIGSKEECNLGKVVSTSFGVNKAYDYVLQHELSKQISTEEDCSADLRGYLPNAQIEKTCSAINPATGKGQAETNLWKKVGTCGKNKEGATLGDCWMKLGDLEKTNPETYREVTQNLCTGTLCGQYQSCTGIQQTTPVSGYKTVVCCQGECKEDTKYASLIQTFEKEDLLKETAYKEMYDYGKGYCESTEYSNNNPFTSSSSIPTSWIDKRKEVEEVGRVSQEEKNKYHYFKGALYLVCGNCAEAIKEFSNLGSGDYFTNACGENKVTSGGMMFNRCSETCSGKKVEEQKTTGEGNVTSEVQILKINGITTTPSATAVDTSNLKIRLETGGEYKIGNIIFNKNVYNCELKFGEQERKTILKCMFTETEPYKFSTIGLGENTTLNILAYETKDSETASEFNFNVEISEKSAKQGMPILCKTYDGANYFCISNTGERCSDYHISSDKAKRASTLRTLEGKNLDGCKAEKECRDQAPYSCLPDSFGYIHE